MCVLGYLLHHFGGGGFLFLLGRLADVVEILGVPFSLGFQGDHSLGGLNCLLFLHNTLCLLLADVCLFFGGGGREEGT